jgi:hypothetical protein
MAPLDPPPPLAAVEPLLPAPPPHAVRVNEPIARVTFPPAVATLPELPAVVPVATHDAPVVGIVTTSDDPGFSDETNSPSMRVAAPPDPPPLTAVPDATTTPQPDPPA